MFAESPANEKHNRAITLALAGVICYLLFFSQLGAIGFVGPDEPRYAEVAREIIASRDWVTPRLYGAPWFEKPMLYYWLAAMAGKIAGLNETTARLPSALAATVTVLVFAALAAKLFDATTAQLTFLFLAGSIGWLGFARAAAFDMLFSACLNLALACLLLLESADEPTTRLRAAYGFQVALGLAVLAKGPAALVLAGGTLLIYVLLTRESGLLRDLLRLGPLAAFLVVAAPWHVAVVQANGWSFVRTYFIAHNIERFLTPVFRHEQGPWFFFAVLPLAIFPWTLLLALPLVGLWRERRRLSLKRSPELLLALWIAVPLLFFTLSRSKLPGYILPAVPALCLLLAQAVAREVGNSRLRWCLLAATASAMLAVVASPWVLAAVRLPIAEARAYRMEYLAALLLLCGIAWLAWKNRALAWALGMTLLLALAANVTLGFLADDIDRSYSARPLAARILAVAPEAVPRTYTFSLSRQLSYGLNFYLARPLSDAETSPLGEPSCYIVLPVSKLVEAEQRLTRRLSVIERLEGEWVLARATVVLPTAAPSGKN